MMIILCSTVVNRMDVLVVTYLLMNGDINVVDCGNKKTELIASAARAQRLVV